MDAKVVKPSCLLKGESIVLEGRLLLADALCGGVRRSKENLDALCDRAGTERGCS